MHLSVALAVMATLAVPCADARAAGDTLGSLRWKARPVVVVSDSGKDPRAARQIAALYRANPALAERDIKVLREARPGGALRKRLGVAARGFAVVLVGKDGDVKQVWTDVVDPKLIFDLIDAMPMRREEMRRNRPG